MVALDNISVLGREKVPFHLPRISLPGAVALAAAILVFGSLVVRGFSDNGFRLASQNSWRFACVVFFAAIMAGPMGRLIPALRRLQQDSCALFMSFCATFGVYLGTVLLPNAFGPRSAEEGTGALGLFVLFGAGVTLVMALALTPRLARLLGAGASRALLGVSAAYFWLCYALMGLAHLSHPHRPDGFYGFSLSLMLIALLVRFADSWMRRRHPAQTVAPA
jgi:hypothetical protein